MRVGVFGRADRADDVERVLAGEFPVAVVVGGNRHDRARTVAPEDVVGDEHGDGASVHGVNAEEAGENAGLDAFFVRALGLGLGCGLRAVGGDCLSGRGRAPGPLFLRAFRPGVWDAELGGVIRVSCKGATKDRVFGCDDHEGCTEEGVGTGRVDVERGLRGSGCFRFGHLEGDGGAFRAADPVALHRADLLRPVDRVEVVSEALAVGGDPHHPLTQVAREDRIVAALGTPFRGDLFIRQDGPQAGAPVHGRFRDVGEAEGVHDLGSLDSVKLSPGAPVGDGDLA